MTYIGRLSESADVNIFTTKYSMAFTVPIFTKLAALQQFYVEIPCTELYPNWTKNVDAGKIVCKLLNKILIECHPYLSMTVERMGRNSSPPPPQIK